MFDLESDITEWRREMLAAGIRNPMPLEELEIHLREEIDRQIKSGIKASQAFQNAVQEIGCAYQLQNEFKKVEGGRKIARVLALIIGWVAASGLLFYCTLGLALDWNFVNFSPKWDGDVTFAILGIILAVTASWFLARASRDKASHIVSLIICVFIASNVVNTFPAEPVEGRGSNFVQMFGRSAPSPLWFRAGISLLLCLPAIFWTWWLLRRFHKQRKPTNENPSLWLS